MGNTWEKRLPLDMLSRYCTKINNMCSVARKAAKHSKARPSGEGRAVQDARAGRGYSPATLFSGPSWSSLRSALRSMR